MRPSDEVACGLFGEVNFYTTSDGERRGQFVVAVSDGGASVVIDIEAAYVDQTMAGLRRVFVEVIERERAEWDTARVANMLDGRVG